MYKVCSRVGFAVSHSLVLTLWYCAEEWKREFRGAVYLCFAYCCIGIRKTSWNE